MTEEQWRDAWRLFQSASGIPPQQISTFLDDATSDPQVRDEVRAMLDGSKLDESFDRIGQKIGRYVLTGRLGEGGMGEVYAARDSELGRPVAVKLLARMPAGGASPVARFIREAKAASALNHPNIVTIYEVIHTESRLAIVMELVDGMSLRQLCGSSQPIDRVLNLGEQIARALTAAHARAIIHCDIKPENLMVRQDGIVKVLDFGLAQDLSSVASTSVLPAGTLRYLSPEQSRGEAASPASDVFCLGIVLYELVTGNHPFESGSLFDTLKALNEAAPRPLASWNAFVPPMLEAVILRMLGKDPSQRPTAAEVARILESRFANQTMGSPLLEIAPSIPIPASKPGQASEAAKSARWRWPVGIAALALLAAVGLAIWWARSGGPSLAFEPAPLTTLPGSEEGPSFSPDGRQVAFRGDQNQQWDIYLKLVGGGPTLRLTSDRGTHWYPAWSPDGERIAFTARHENGRNGLFVMPALGGPERLLAELDGDWRSADWSPDGKWIAVSPPASANFDPGTGVTLISAQTGERSELVKQDAEMSQSAFGRFSPDGKRLAFLKMRGAFGRLYLADLTPGMRLNGRPRQILPGELEAQFPAWTADGREIVFMSGFASSNGSLARVPVNGGPVRKIPGLGYTAGPVAIARKGGRMSFSRGGIDSDIWRLDTMGEEPPRKWIVSTVADIAAEYSPDGRKIAFSSNRSGPREIWVSDADGGNAVQLTHFGGPITGTARWSPDGRWIAFDSRPRGVPDVFVISAEGSGLRQLTDQSAAEEQSSHKGMWQPAWSADGKWIYFSSDRSGRFEIWRMSWLGGRSEQVTKDGGSSAYPSRDNDWVYYENGEPGLLRRVKPDGSGDSVITDRPINLLQYAATPRGVYFVVSSENRNQLQRLLPDGKIVSVLELPFHAGLGLSISPDGRYVLITKPDENGTDLMLVEGFR